MSDYKLYSGVSVGFLLLMFALFFTGNWSPVPGLGYVIGSAAIMFGWVSMKLTKSIKAIGQERQQEAALINELRWFFVFAAIFAAVDTIPHVLLPIFYPDVSLITTTHWLAHLILFITSVLAARFSIAFFNPNHKNKVTIFVTLVGMIAIATSIIRPDTLFYIPGSPYPLIHSDILYAYFNQVLNVASFGLGGAYLLIRGFMSNVPVVRTRAILIGVGLMSEVAVGYVIHFVSSPLTPVIVYILFVGWFGFLGTGALYTTRKIVGTAPATNPALVN